MLSKTRIMSKIEKSNITKQMPNWYSTENFFNDAKEYIKTIKEGRMIVGIMSVAPSGMSRVFKFNSCEKGKNNTYRYRQFDSFLISLGYKVNRQGEFRVSGCGMDMVFATNYNIIRDIYRLGFVSKKQCETLEQQTPQYL